MAAWLREAIAAAEQRGVPRDRLVVDPGIGFGKGSAENLELLHRLAELKAAVGGLPMLVGTSRKRFLGELLGGTPPDDRVEGTAATVALAIAAGADIVRVHDVAHDGPRPYRRRCDDATMTAPDRLSLLGMRFLGRHGVLPTEKVDAQPFEVDLVLHADLTEAAERDDLAATVDYAALFDLVRAIVEGTSHDLIEGLAGSIARAVLAATPSEVVDAVEVRVRKPEAPIDGSFDTVEASILRRRGPDAG